MKTTEDFKKQCMAVHGNKYDYSKVEYKGSKKKVCIICPEHGEFWQEANSHLKGCGCPKCCGTLRKSNEEFIAKSKSIFGDKFLYDKTDYKNNSAKVCITCKIHGDFYTKPANHLHGCGCPECSGVKRYSTEEYIKKADSIHNGVYNYDKTRYVNSATKITVTCKKHGDFQIRASRHLQGQGCPACGIDKIRSNVDEFKKKANALHNFKYSYKNSVYKTSKDKLEIICPIHGSFFMTPNCHLMGQGCPKCGDEKMASKSRLGRDKTLEKFKTLYGNKYDYTRWKNVYKNVEDSIPIICSKHGLFYKTIHQHLQGQGCPKCQSSALQNNIRDFLTRQNIDFEEEKKFEWLKYKDNSNMRLDFFLPRYNVAIECQGEQHYKPIELFGGEKTFQYQIQRDKAKLEQCRKNGIDVIYFANKKYVSNIITNKKELLKEIKKYE